MGSPCTLLLLASSSLSSALDSFSARLLGVLGKVLSLYLSPYSVLSTVCLLAADLPCVFLFR